VSVTGSETRGADPEIRARQIDAQQSGHGLALATWLIRRKLQGSVVTLGFLPRSTRVDIGIQRIQNLEGAVRSLPPNDVNELLMVEARAASAYFAAWQSLTIRWKGIGRRPIPPEWRRMPIRQSLLGGSNQVYEVHHLTATTARESVNVILLPRYT
jgi:CRISPR/Cas system-associated endonuclease Cas1